MNEPTRSVSFFQDGLARVNAAGGVVLIDREGKFVTEPGHWAERVAKGFWYVQKNNLTTEIVQAEGKLVDSLAGLPSYRI